jgi:hypothetical protein
MKTKKKQKKPNNTNSPHIREGGISYKIKTRPKMKSTITIDNGKYTLSHENGTKLTCLRYGGPWRDCLGDGLILALVQEIEVLNLEILELRNESRIQTKQK